MKQCSGQIDFAGYLSEKNKKVFGGCGECICDKCLYWWSSRCPYGKCYDSKRAKENPYDKAHPDKPPRTAWSDWKTQQAYWCRGGIFYLVSYCEHFVKYQGSTVEDCVAAPVQTFQDGHISCSLKDTIGCEECIRRSEGLQEEKSFACEYMRDTGCERMITAKSLMLQEMLENNEKDIEMCKEQCCIGCNKSCGYRCGQAWEG